MWIDSQKQKEHHAGHKGHLGILKGQSQLVDRVMGCRYELKYLISESLAEAIAQYIKPYLHLDHYCKIQPNRSYPIVSLYLDSDNFLLCHESLVGKKNRFKLRIRSYTDDADYPRFFEIKRRLNSIVVKSRARVSHNEVTPLLLRHSAKLRNFKNNDETLRQFQLYSDNINARPVIQVRYNRQAYEGDTENRVRVTFDRQLSYNTSSLTDVVLNGRGWQKHHSNEVILEIKFTGRYPAWLNQMVKCLNLCQDSFSKYVTSVKQACVLGWSAPGAVVP